MRRLFCLVFVLTTLVLAAPPAMSAPRPDVSVRLLGMAPWLTPQDTDLGLHVLATNLGPGPARDLTFNLTLFTPSRTRNQYEESLHRDPVGALDLYANFVNLGVLKAGASVDLQFSEDIVQTVGSILAEKNETAIYPMNIDVRSGDRATGSLP